MLRVALGKQTF